MSPHVKGAPVEETGERNDPCGEIDERRFQGDVIVRMYSQGLGDCFLLTLPRARHPGAIAADRPVHVLIDCGVVMGTPDDTERMRAIVADIAATTGNRLDLLILTHEHWDPLYGFIQAEQEWEKIEVNRLWTAWTEKDDPDGLPGILKRIQEKQRRAFTRIADQALRLGFENDQKTAIGLMSFLGDAPVDGMSFAAAATVGDAFQKAKGLAPADRHVFCEPGEVRPVPETDAICYVLGPPRSDTRLRQTGPSKDLETFSGDDDPAFAASDLGRSLRARALAELDAAFPLKAMEDKRSRLNAFAMPLLGPDLLGMDGVLAEDNDPIRRQEQVLEWETYEQTFPFDRSFRVALSDAERAATEDPDAHAVLASYIDDTSFWRRIDVDWLTSASDFAIQANHLTNNTSLVLAIELPAERADERKVLLFVGDAQVGNWMSWYDIQEWQSVDGAQPARTMVDIDDLLRRVEFYKAGHHGSHNATLKERGLERMSGSGSFTAFVPVSTPVAREIKNWTEMPLDNLMDALSERSDGRVVFPDGNLWPNLIGDALIKERGRIGVTISNETLPRKERGPENDRVTLEDKVPLWVQIVVPY
ncbi:hypothetical protein BH20CHL3_BH20CHL3_04350 [soil metagenome]